MKKLAVLLIVALLFSVTGCNKIQSENMMIDKKPREVSGITELSEKNVVLTDFGVRLFQESFHTEKNILISPISLVYALGMTANGATGETLEEMEAVIGMPVDELNEYLYSYQKKLSQGDKYELSLANSIWFTDDERVSIEEDFLQINADYYGSDVYRTPFDDQTVKDINNWVKQNTNEVIPKILDEIPKEAVMYLVNALAFEAEWQKVYYDSQVREDVFTLEDGTKQNVEFMFSEEYNYLEDENTIGFLKYYADCKYAFVALLPNEGISIRDYVADLSGEKVNHFIENRKEGVVFAAIPKFKTEFNVNVKEILLNMGLKSGFDAERADFSRLGTSTDGNIYISRVLQNAFISVGEKGTEAGAATLVEMNDEGAAEPKEIKRVYLDRPFIYMLIDCETNIPFFIGTMMQVE